jgi:predicted DNA-binding transcriptional regulator AlpA
MEAKEGGRPGKGEYPRERGVVMRIVEKLQDQLCYPPRLLAADRAAAYIGFGPTKFSDMVADGRMPLPVDIDGSPRWDRLELDAAVENLKDRRRDPVARDHDRLEQRIRAMEGKT